MRLSLALCLLSAPLRRSVEYDYYTTAKGILGRKSEPMQAMDLKCSLSCYPFFPPVISVDMPMRREK